jgi:hypothetical protein
MKAKLLSVAVALVALAAAPPALADSGTGGLLAGLQNATTSQVAAGLAASQQNAVNANVPVSIAGGNVNAGPSAATQIATSAATTNVTNNATTNQNQSQQQTVGGSSSCQAGCGGAGGAQIGGQNADTHQVAIGVAHSKQNAVNANVPVSIAGGDVNSGPSAATQNAGSSATTNVNNNATTNQGQSQQQTVGGSSSCHVGCGGAGGAQAGVQKADTHQGAIGVAKSDQTAVNANVPVSIAGGDVNSGPSAATQTAGSSATTSVNNNATTNQGQSQHQEVDGSDSCLVGCGGAGGFQAGVQKADTHQGAIGVAKSDQNAVNANVPVSIAGGDVNSGPSSANQTATSTATANVGNNATTNQEQSQQQTVGGSGACLLGCGGAGGAQIGVQKAETKQFSLGLALSNQNAVNGNAPVASAGGDVNSGPSSANQTATSTATANVGNNAATNQGQSQGQTVGGNGSCFVGCGGPGGAQLGVQNAETKQIALGLAGSDQNAVNGNAPHAVAGGDVNSGPSSANQTATSTATTNVGNNATTNQGQSQQQTVGGNGACLLGCGGAGGAQLGVQNAETKQIALGLAGSEQNAVNGNAPGAGAGGNVNSGPSSATQSSSSNAGTTVLNNAGTNQGQESSQQLSPERVLSRGRGSTETTRAASIPATTTVTRTTTTTRTVNGVAGVRATRVVTVIRHRTGVLGARTRGTLPFTGVSLLGAALLGLLLMVAGLVIRCRLGRRGPDLLEEVGPN